MRDMTNIGFPSRPRPTPVPIKPEASTPAPARRKPSSRTTSPATIAAFDGVIAVHSESRKCGGPDSLIGDFDQWYTTLTDAVRVSWMHGDLTAHMGEHFGLRALTRGDWSLAVVFRDDSPISKSLIRAMRTCLENLNEGRVKP